MSQGDTRVSAVVSAFPTGKRARLSVLDEVLADHVPPARINLLKENIRQYLDSLMPTVIDPPDHIRAASHVLLIPTTTSHEMQARPDPHGYQRAVQAICFDNCNNVRAFNFNRIPAPDDVKGGKKSKKFNNGLQERRAELVDMVSNEVAYRGNRGGKYRKFADSFALGFVKETDDIAALVDADSIIDQRKREYLKLVLRQGILPEGWKSSTYTPDGEGGLDKEEHEEIQLPMETIETVLAEVERLDREQIQAQVSIFNTVLNEDVLDIMEGIPGQQTSGVYHFLDPYARQSLVEEFSGDKPKRTRPKSVVMPDEDKALARRALLGKYPLIASITDLGDSSKANHVDNALSSNGARTFTADQETIDHAADLVMGLPQQRRDAILSHLAGLTEHDTGASVASRMRNLAPYLLYVSSEDVPQQSGDWASFAEVVGMDQRLSNLKIRRHGRLLIDYAPSDHDDINGWGDVKGKLGPEYVDQMVSYMRCIGLSVFMSALKRLKEENGLRDVKDRDLPLIAAVNEPLLRGLASAEAREFVDQGHNMTLAGIYFDRFDTPELLQLGGIFSTHQSGKASFESLRRQLAGQTAMTHDAESYHFWTLPSMTFAERMASEDLMGIVPEPIDHAGNLQMTLDALGHSISKADYFDSDIHYVQFYNDHRGRMSVSGLAIYEEWREVGKDKLYLRPKLILRPDGEYTELDARGQIAYSSDGAKSLGIVDAASRYADFVNSRHIDVAPIRPHREALLKQALSRPEGIDLLSGYKTGDTRQSQQAYNTLHDYYGSQVRGSRNDALDVIPGVFIPPEVIDGIYAALNGVSEEDVPIPPVILRQIRGREVGGERGGLRNALD